MTAMTFIVDPALRIRDLKNNPTILQNENS